MRERKGLFLTPALNSKAEQIYKLYQTQRTGIELKILVCAYDEEFHECLPRRLYVQAIKVTGIKQGRYYEIKAGRHL
jgi:hypothetical protein